MTWIILGVLALVVIFVIVSYNGLVKNRMQTKVPAFLAQTVHRGIS